ncbi:MAG TPA: choice-of-anchor D domain-containing protein [Kofleriaceae bacterium]
MRRLVITLVLVGACGGGETSDPASLAILDSSGHVQAALSFEKTALGQSTESMVRLRNVGGEPTGEIAMAIDGAGTAEFAIASETCSGGLDAADECQIDLRFHPVAEGVRSTTLTVAPASGGTTSMSLSGESVAAALSLDPSHTALGLVGRGSPKDVVIGIQNTAAIDAPLETMSIDGVGFTLKSSTCTDVLVADASCEVTVGFAPTELGASSGELVVRSFGVAYRSTFEGRGAEELVVAAGGAGAGSITSTPAGIDCGSTCSALFDQTVTLVAAPEAGAEIAAWSEATCSGDTCIIDVATLPRTVSARFVSPIELTASPGLVELGTTGSTSVSVRNAGSSPSPVGAMSLTGAEYAIGSSTCGSSLAAGATCIITLAFTPSALGPRAGSLEIELDGVSRSAALASVGASRLSITRLGVGSGTITSAPAGLDCGSTCTGLFGGSVVLTAVPQAGSTVTSWSAPGCTGNVCTLAASTIARTVTVTFGAGPSHTITVTRDGTGTGAVTSSPPGISCGATCQNTFAGLTVLTATPTSDSTFIAWSDRQCGTSSSCTIPAGTDPRTITATFGPRCQGTCGTLSLTIAGDGSGDVRINKNGNPVAACASSCTVTVPTGPLTVNANTMNALGGMSGVCTAPARQGYCAFTMNASGSLAVTFTKDPKERWTFFGNPGEAFSSAAFDHAGDLVVSSFLRLIKLGATGEVIWIRTGVRGTIFIGPSNEIYVYDDSGTVKLDANGNTLWTVPETGPFAVMPGGDVLVNRRLGGMKRMTPAGSELWSTSVGSGAGVDHAGRIYEGYAVEDEFNTTLHARRYSAANGAPLDDFGVISVTVSKGNEKLDMVVTPSHAVGFASHIVSFNDTIFVTGYNVDSRAQEMAMTKSRENAARVILASAMTTAGSDVGVGYVLDDIDNGYGYGVVRLSPGVPNWTFTRRSLLFGPDPMGFKVGGIGGGPDGAFAVLGRFEAVFQIGGFSTMVRLATINVFAK